MRVAICAVLLAGLAAAGTAPAMGDRLEAYIDPDAHASPFRTTHQMAAFIEYAPSGALSELLDGADRTIMLRAGPEDPGVQQLMADLNGKICSDGGQTSVNDLAVEYTFRLVGSNSTTSMNFEAVLTGNLTGYVVLPGPTDSAKFSILDPSAHKEISVDTNRTVIDFAWVGLGSDESVIVDGVDINMPLNVLRDHEPAVYDLVRDTKVGGTLSAHLIKADCSWSSMLTYEGWPSSRGYDDDGRAAYEPQPDASWNPNHLPFSVWNRVMYGHTGTKWHEPYTAIRPPNLWGEGCGYGLLRASPAAGLSHPSIPGEIYDLRAGRLDDKVIIFVVGFGPEHPPLREMGRNLELGYVVPSKVDPPPVPPPIEGHTFQSADCRTYEFVTFQNISSSADVGRTQAGTPAITTPFIYVISALAAVGGVLFFVFNRAQKNGKSRQAPSRASV